MNKTLLLILLGSLSLHASDNIWSKNTKTLTQSKSEQILQAYENSDTSELNFKDDSKKKPNLYNFKENIFVVGLSVGGASISEEISNKTGSVTSSYSSINTKLMIAKDFTLWNEEYTQPTRLFFSYAFTTLDNDVDFTTYSLGIRENNDVDFTTYSLGIRENMEYYTFYETASYRLYPTLSLELGKSYIDRGSESIQGFSTEINLGVNYVRDDNFEYFLNLSATSTNWSHPVDGIADEMSGFGLSIGLNYKLNYGDL